MNTSALRQIALAAALLAATSPFAHADGAVDIRLHNNTSDTLRVTLIDLNARPAQRVITGDVINGFATLRLSVTPDASGLAHVSWTAHTIGSGSQRRCAQRDKPGLAAGADVKVYANTDCPAATATDITDTGVQSRSSSGQR
jgi:hypothetical protein